MWYHEDGRCEISPKKIIEEDPNSIAILGKKFATTPMKTPTKAPTKDTNNMPTNS